MTRQSVRIGRAPRPLSQRKVRSWPRSRSPTRSSSSTAADHFELSPCSSLLLTPKTEPLGLKYRRPRYCDGVTVEVVRSPNSLLQGRARFRQCEPEPARVLLVGAPAVISNDPHTSPAKRTRARRDPRPGRPLQAIPGS